MAYNLSFRDLREIVVPGILELCIGRQSSQITKIIERWFPIVKKFVHTAEDEIDLLNVVVKFLLRNLHMIDQFPIILKDLFHNDLLEEDSTLKWYENMRDAVGPLSQIRNSVKLVNKADPFIDWLKESDSGLDSDEITDDSFSDETETDDDTNDSE